MKQERRSAWWQWTCDGPGCGLQDRTHEKGEAPAGWITIDPPAPWKGPQLAFHSAACSRGYVEAALSDVALLGSGQ